MASILFDDITFPRELYDPDTFDFVPPVSTLLAFTPHILSQLAKSSEGEQETMDIPSTKVENNDAEAQPEPLSSEQQSSATGIFSTLKSIAASQNTQRIFENGIYLAGRYMEGSVAASSSRHRDRDYEDQYRRGYSTRNSSKWFGYDQTERPWDRERQRMKEMEERLLQMERDMRHNSAMARSEVEAQRRERYKLEQELEAQKAKVKKLQSEMEEQQRQDALKSQRKKEDEVEQKRKSAQESKNAQKSKKDQEIADSSEDPEDSKDSDKSALLKKGSNTYDGSIATNPVALASVGVASLVMTLYSAHRASSTYSVVSFHDQLEVLMAQCQSVIQSTEAWISEQFLEVPEQIREDLKMIKELMETIQRLDPRSEKKAEAVAWSMSAVGSLGAVGGAFIGSMTAMASGGTVVVGCALYGIISRARYNGPEYSTARIMMEMKAAKILKSLGVNPASPSAASSSASGRSSLVHEGRTERLRIEFERREAHDLRDADEIDGLAVEEALRQSSFSAPFVSQKASARAARSRQQSAATAATETEVIPPSLKTEPKRASVCFA
ncbi:hypothetical protein BGX28_001518 [Mortierella sp. GBA30]|nr:hypothetical protein BGX28_001518 [Mortierella sp. GBA30]